jgi:CheY-like chemotaxis protein
LISDGRFAEDEAVFPLVRSLIKEQKIPEFLMPANILIVDDYADNRELLRLMLESAGYHIREAEDGRTGLDMARAEMPDLILVDLSMPQLDGWEVLDELRAHEGTRRIPCVAVTAFADRERERALERGFDAYLSKPFRRTELIETVERMLARRPSEAAGGV